jgi:hypothetical protein
MVRPKRRVSPEISTFMMRLPETGQVQGNA